MKFLKKPITIRIPVFWTALILLLVVVIAVCLYLRIPDNLFFMLMEPDWVSSAQVQFGEEWQDLTPEQLADVVDILNEFRFKNRLKNTIGPPLGKYAAFRLDMKCGKTIYISCRTYTEAGIGYDQYTGSPALKRLHELYRQYLKAYISEKGNGAFG